MEQQALPHDLYAVILTKEDVTPPPPPGPPEPLKSEVYLARWIEQVKDTPEYQRRVNWKAPF